MWMPTLNRSAITPKSCKAYLQARTPAGGVADLKLLKSALVYWHHSEYGPLAAMPAFWRPPENEPKDRWLARHEAAKLLRAARPYQHLRRALLLGLYTGSRPGVILALRWSQIDLASKTLSRTPPRAKLSRTKRAPKVRLGDRILSHLRRWKRMDGQCPFVCHFDGKPGGDPHTAWRKVVKAAGLDGTGVTRHTWRHTRATRMMQAGVPIWEAAGFLGMSIKTLERAYGHHSPDHQERAANI